MGEIKEGGLYAVKAPGGGIAKYVDAKGKEIESADLPEHLRGRAAAAEGGGGGGDTTPQAKTFGELPAGYPGAEHFVAAGLTTRKAVESKTDEELVALNGIGTATVAKVREFATKNPLQES